MDAPDLNGACGRSVFVFLPFSHDGGGGGVFDLDFFAAAAMKCTPPCVTVSVSHVIASPALTGNASSGSTTRRYLKEGVSVHAYSFIRST